MTTRRAGDRPVSDTGGALQALADRHGVQTVYEAADGRPRPVDPSVVAAVLGVLGVPVTGPADAAEAWRADQARRATQVLPPVVVHRLGDGSAPSLPVHLPTASATASGGDRRTGRITLELEGGTRLQAPLADVLGPAVAGTSVDGRCRTRHRLSLARLGPLPMGYHRLTVTAAGASGSATMVVAPGHCPQPPRQWGLTAPVYALRGDDDWGAGGLRELGTLADWAMGLGAGLTGTLPLYAAFLDGPDLDPSPYRPASRLAWNEAFVDLGALPELGEVPAAAEAMRAARRRTATLAAADLADLPAVLAAKRTVLEPLAAAVLGGRAAPGRRAAFDRWALANPEAVAYARFRATGTAPDRTAVAPAPRVDPDRSEDVALATWCYGQWVVDEQLGALARRAPLYLDVPVGVHPRGFDPAWEPEAYVHGAAIGAPPDLFFSGGQNWGLPPLHPQGSRRQGHRHLAAVLRRAMSRAAVVRLDHVMGLHRLWFVPEGAAATDGAYVRYPSDELRAVVALEAARAGAAVVGEDLGTVPDEVRRDMAADGMLRSAVWQFDATPADPFPVPPEASLASLGTHDLPTLAGFLTAGDEGTAGDDPAADERAERAERRALRRAVGPGLEDALWRCLTHLAASPARLTLVDVADLWLEHEQQNVPGTGAEAGSFRRRARRTLAELAGDRAVVDLLRAVDVARRTASPSEPPASSTSRGGTLPSHGRRAGPAEGPGARPSEGEKR